MKKLSILNVVSLVVFVISYTYALLARRIGEFGGSNIVNVLAFILMIISAILFTFTFVKTKVYDKLVEKPIYLYLFSLSFLAYGVVVKFASIDYEFLPYTVTFMFMAVGYFYSILSFYNNKNMLKFIIRLVSTTLSFLAYVGILLGKSSISYLWIILPIAISIFSYSLEYIIKDSNEKTI